MNFFAKCNSRECIYIPLARINFRERRERMTYCYNIIEHMGRQSLESILMRALLHRV